MKLERFCLRILLCVFVAYGILNALETNESLSVENGKTIILTTTDKNPQPVHLHKKTYQWISHPQDANKKIAILSIPYYTNPSKIVLDDGTEIEILQGNYKKEKIQVSQQKAKPNAKNQERIKKERDEANKIYSNYEKCHYKPIWKCARF